MDNNINDNKWQSVFDENIAKYGYKRFGFVYRVFCPKTGVSYVGQSKDATLSMGVPNRIRTHYQALRRGCHSMRELQASWDSHSEYFEDELLEIVDTSIYGKLSEREKHWQDVYKLEGSLQLDSKKHYQLKESELRELYQIGIINTKTLIYFALKLKNPWCDRPLKVDPIAIAADYGIPESSAYKAILQLKEIKVLTIGRSEMVIQWSTVPSLENQQDKTNDNRDEILRSENELSKVRMDSQILECDLKSENELSKVRMDSQILECDLKSENELSKVRMDSQILENQKLESLPAEDSTTSQTIQTIQINQTIHTPPLPPQRGGEGEDEKDLSMEDRNSRAEGKEVEQVSVSDRESKSDFLSQTKLKSDRHWPPRRSTISDQYNTKDDERNGPWMVENKSIHGRVKLEIDDNFVTWLASRWLKDPKYNRDSSKDLYGAKGDVRAHFSRRRDPEGESLENRWREYQEYLVQRYNGLLSKASAGADITQEEKDSLLKHSRAIADLVDLSKLDVDNLATLPTADTGNWKENIPEDAENGQAYKPYTPPQEEYEPLSPEAIAHTRKLLQSIGVRVPSFVSDVSEPAADPIFEREALEHDLNDPISHSEALKRARTCDRFSIDFDGDKWTVTED